MRMPAACLASGVHTHACMRPARVGAPYLMEGHGAPVFKVGLLEELLQEGHARLGEPGVAQRLRHNRVACPVLSAVRDLENLQPNQLRMHSHACVRADATVHDVRMCGQCTRKRGRQRNRKNTKENSSQ